MSLERLAALLRERRRALGLTQEQVAERLGWHQTEISELERVDHPNLRMDWLVKLGQLYGLSPNELAAAAGWWQGPSLAEEDDPYLQLLILQLQRLPPDRRAAVIRHAMLVARAEKLAQSPRSEASLLQPSTGPVRPRHPARSLGR